MLSFFLGGWLLVLEGCALLSFQTTAYWGHQWCENIFLFHSISLGWLRNTTAAKGVPSSGLCPLTALCPYTRKENIEFRALPTNLYDDSSSNFVHIHLNGQRGGGVDKMNKVGGLLTITGSGYKLDVLMSAKSMNGRPRSYREKRGLLCRLGWNSNPKS